MIIIRKKIRGYIFNTTSYFDADDILRDLNLEPIKYLGLVYKILDELCESGCLCFIYGSGFLRKKTLEERKNLVRKIIEKEYSGGPITLEELSKECKKYEIKDFTFCLGLLLIKGEIKYIEVFEYYYTRERYYELLNAV